MSASVTDHLYRNVTIASVPIAPHRYLWSDDGAWRDMEPLSDFKQAIPYKEGEAVWIDVPGRGKTLALIYRVGWERDNNGDRREVYKVLHETQKGVFSNRWRYAYAGFIQRGYRLAGLAPDVPEDV